MTTMENETAGWLSIMRRDGRNIEDFMRERNYAPRTAECQPEKLRC